MKKYIIGMAPMDGVTDAAFRFITAKYGKPDIIYTEFTTVEGICAGATKTLRPFIYDKSERPIIAQLFGTRPEAFYKAAFVVFELGFDGIDINMGCPAKNIAGKGSGASLIQKPAVAKKIVLKVKEAAKEWSEGKKITSVGLPDEIIEKIKEMKRGKKIVRRELPVSVKTRTGYNQNTIEEWIKHLLEVNPSVITIHGRTFKQLYGGEANWESIKKAVEIAKGSGTRILGNGDIKSLADAKKRIAESGVDGALIGRAAFGNPWIFCGKEPDIKEKFAVAIEHTKLFAKIFKTTQFVAMRKHLAWYCKGFIGASETRQKLMTTNNPEEVEEILKGAMEKL